MRGPEVEDGKWTSRGWQSLVTPGRRQVFKEEGHKATGWGGREVRGLLSVKSDGKQSGAKRPGFQATI